MVHQLHRHESPSGIMAAEVLRQVRAAGFENVHSLQVSSDGAAVQIQKGHLPLLSQPAGHRRHQGHQRPWGNPPQAAEI
jgi:hypothetical protein